MASIYPRPSCHKGWNKHFATMKKEKSQGIKQPLFTAQHNSLGETPTRRNSHTMELKTICTCKPIHILGPRSLGIIYHPHWAPLLPWRVGTGTGGGGVWRLHQVTMDCSCSQMAAAKTVSHGPHHDHPIEISEHHGHQDELLSALVISVTRATALPAEPYKNESQVSWKWHLAQSHSSSEYQLGILVDASKTNLVLAAEDSFKTRWCGIWYSGWGPCTPDYCCGTSLKDP